MDLARRELDQIHQELSAHNMIRQFAHKYPNLVTSESSLRHQIRNQDNNGLKESGAISKVTGRWLIHAGRYAAWLSGSRPQQSRNVSHDASHAA